MRKVRKSHQEQHPPAGRHQIPVCTWIQLMEKKNKLIKMHYRMKQGQLEEFI